MASLDQRNLLPSPTPSVDIPTREQITPTISHTHKAFNKTAANVRQCWPLSSSVVASSGSFKGGERHLSNRTLASPCGGVVSGLVQCVVIGWTCNYMVCEGVYGLRWKSVQLLRSSVSPWLTHQSREWNISDRLPLTHGGTIDSG